jgi:hypothetical protein
MASTAKDMGMGPAESSDVDAKKVYHDVVKETGSNHDLGSTASDVKDMDRMGKPQQFKVRENKL